LGEFVNGWHKNVLFAVCQQFALLNIRLAMLVVAAAVPVRRNHIEFVADATTSNLFYGIVAANGARDDKHRCPAIVRIEAVFFLLKRLGDDSFPVVTSNAFKQFADTTMRDAAAEIVALGRRVLSKTLLTARCEKLAPFAMKRRDRREKLAAVARKTLNHIFSQK
jgi:hypothetical protein